MKKVGIIGWRGMVGSVLMQRMREENDFSEIEAIFFSVSNPGAYAPAESQNDFLFDAYDLKRLSLCDIILTCQGSAYTQDIYFRLRSNNWNGYWIDIASVLRLRDDAIIVLDPVNLPIIQTALKNGIKNYIGGNCTVSCMLMALAGLIKHNMIEWISSMTYQAASGAGAAHMRELLKQFGDIYQEAMPLLDNHTSEIIKIDRVISNKLQNLSQKQKMHFGVPLAGSLIPWIDSDLGTGQSREEAKSSYEFNKILGKTNNLISVDGICVRVGVMRCHSQALTIKLKDDLPLSEIATMIESAHEWIMLIPNEKSATMNALTPAAVSGLLKIAIGRLRKMHGPYICAFTVGDQLLWGAAEPLRRFLRILLEY